MEPLTDGVITIRPPEPADAGAVAAAVQASLPELMPWMPWATPDYDTAAALAWINREIDPSANPFLITDSQGELVGSTGINEIREQNAIGNLGYWIRSDRAGEGLATRAVPLIARYGHEQLGLHRIEILMSVRNEASRRVAEKAGARHEGVERGRLLLRGEHHDVHMFSLLPADLA